MIKVRNLFVLVLLSMFLNNAQATPQKAVEEIEKWIWYKNNFQNIKSYLNKRETLNQKHFEEAISNHNKLLATIIINNLSITEIQMLVTHLTTPMAIENTNIKNLSKLITTIDAEIMDNLTLKLTQHLLVDRIKAQRQHLSKMG